MRKDEGEIVANHLLAFIYPDLLAQNPDSPCAPEARFVIDDLARASLSAQRKNTTADDACDATSARPSEKIPPDEKDFYTIVTRVTE